MRLALAGAVFAGGSLPALAAPSGADDLLRQGEVRQGQIRTRTEQATGRVAGILDEYLRNALEGEDAEVLAEVRGSLADLGDDEMARVLDLLQGARREPAEDAARNRVGDAYAVQKDVVVELERILLECRRRMAVHELAARVARLMERQDENLWSILGLAREAPAMAQESFDERQKTALRVQRAEQEALARESAATVARIESAAGEAGGAGAVASALAAARDRGIDTVPAAAEADLAAGRMFRASSDARRSRNALRALARGLVPPRDVAEALRRAVADIDREIARQGRLLAEARVSQMHRYESLAMEHRQADVMDKTDLVQEDVATPVPEAGALLGGACDAMLQARVELESPLDAEKRGRVVRNQEAALDRLNRARELLLVAVANTEHKGQQVIRSSHGQGLGKTQSGSGRQLGKLGLRAPKGMGSGTGESEGGVNLGESDAPGGEMRRDVPGAAQVIALPPRDRAVIQQSRTEPVPAEYAPLVELYLKSVAGDEGTEPAAK